MVTGLSCPAAASTSALSRRSSPIAASYSRTAAGWAAVSPGHDVPSAGLVLEQHEIGGLVLVRPDDPAPSGLTLAAPLTEPGPTQLLAACPASTSTGCSTSSPSITIWISSLTTMRPSRTMLKLSPKSFLLIFVVAP